MAVSQTEQRPSRAGLFAFLALGFAPEVMERPLARASQKPLSALQSAYANAAVISNRFMREAPETRTPSVQPAWSNQEPKAAMADRRQMLRPTYHQPAVRTHASARMELPRLFDPRTRRPAMLQRLVNQEPKVRHAFERIAGAKVLGDRRADGCLSLYEPKPGSADAGVGVSSSAFSVSDTARDIAQRDATGTFYELLARCEAQVLDEAASMRASFSFGPLGGISSSDPLGEKDGALRAGEKAEDEDEEEVAPDVAIGVFQLDTDRLEQMYNLIRTMFEKQSSTARTAVDQMKS